MSKVNLIIAVDHCGGIGLKGNLPWPKSEGDLFLFKHITENNVVIMGKNTYKSLPETGLPNRINIVITNNSDDVKVDNFNDIKEAIEFAKTYEKEIFIIGGKSIYEQSLQYIDGKILMTIMKDIYDYETDVKLSEEFMNDIEFKYCFAETFNKEYQYFTFHILKRIKDICLI